MTVGIKQRRERERQEIRQSILEAARQIAAEDGWQAVTTRKVAELIEYSQPTIYEYFENKEAILLSAIVMVCLIPAQRRIPEQIPARDEGQDHSSAELMSIAS